jgi:hypothetical protein
VKAARRVGHVDVGERMRLDVVAAARSGLSVAEFMPDKAERLRLRVEASLIVKKCYASFLRIRMAFAERIAAGRLHDRLEPKHERSTEHQPLTVLRAPPGAGIERVDAGDDEPSRAVAA